MAYDCIVCGAELPGTRTKAAKYCSKCYAERRRIQNIAKMRRYREKKLREGLP